MTDGIRHPHALVESANIGPRTRIWAFAHVLPGAVIGADCNICDGVFVENDVVVGDRVTVKCGVQLWDGVTLEDDVFVGPNATFTNDLFPRSRQHPATYARTVVKRGASIGANATILAGITIGEDAMVGAGAVVTTSVPPRTVVAGNPARVMRTLDDPDNGHRPSVTHPHVSSNTIPSLTVTTATVVTLPVIPDTRGVLSFGQTGDHLPFAPQRYFTIAAVQPGTSRGNHAHRQCHQFFVCIQGAFTLGLDDGRSRDAIRVDSPAIGIHAKPLTWCTLSEFTADAVILVLASDRYDDGDYIRDYALFREQVGAAS